MANNENLRPLNTLPKEDAKAIRSKGSYARAEKIRKRKTMCEMLNYLLEKEITNKAGEKASTLEAISVSMIKQAMNGNVKAFEVIRDTIGEKNIDTIININQAVQVNKQDVEDAVKIINDLR